MKNKKFNNRENECINHNGRELWISRSVTVVTTVFQIFDGKLWVLLAQRGPASPNAVGKWNLPCGYIDWDENGTQAAKREVWEETGIFIDDFKDCVAFNHLDTPWRINTEPDGIMQNLSLHYGVVLDLRNAEVYPEITSENAEEGEVSALGWFPLELALRQDLAFNHGERINNFYNVCKDKMPEMNGLIFSEIPLE